MIYTNCKIYLAVKFALLYKNTELFPQIYVNTKIEYIYNQCVNMVKMYLYK